MLDKWESSRFIDDPIGCMKKKYKFMHTCQNNLVLYDLIMDVTVDRQHADGMQCVGRVSRICYGNEKGLYEWYSSYGVPSVALSEFLYREPELAMLDLYNWFLRCNRAIKRSIKRTKNGTLHIPIDIDTVGILSPEDARKEFEGTLERSVK